MQYKAENVDTDKALDFIERCRKEDSHKEYIERISVEKLHEGIRQGLDMAEQIFECRNYEKQAIPVSYEECAADAIHKIASRLDVKCSDIRQSGKCMDEMCADFADRVLEVFDRKEGTDDMREVEECGTSQ